MAGPRFLVDNIWNLQQYPDHVLTAEEETAGNEVWRVGSGRRVGGGVLRNYWTPTTANSDSWIECKCDRTRAADMLVIDRSHNLAGKTVKLEISDDNYTTTTEVFSVVLPTNVYSNSRLSDTPGVKTTEGAFIISFPFHVALYWRVFSSAMGASLKPQIPGCYLGKSFAPTNAPSRPWDEEPSKLVYDTIVSSALWTSSSRKAERRESTVSMFMASDVEEDRARYYFRALRRSLVWYVPDTDRAERAWLAEAPPGVDSQVFPTNYARRVITVAMVEHQPSSA